MKDSHVWFSEALPNIEVMLSSNGEAVHMKFVMLWLASICNSVWSIHPSVRLPYICTVMSGWENMRGWHQGSWKGPSLFKKMFSAENSSTFCMLFFILMFQMDLPFQRWQESIIASLRREKAKFEVLDYISISVFSLCLRFWLHDRHKLFFCIAG